MKTPRHRSQVRQQWLKKPISAKAFQHWLIDNGSLTARLQSRYQHFAVKPVTMKYAKPFRDEAALLDLPAHKNTLIREVILTGDNQPVVFAHSVLPLASLRGAWNGLGRLGNKPLGATLFANPKVKRTPLAYKKLPRQHPISMRVAEHLQRRPAALWARRSIFSLYSANQLNTANSKYAKILVTEVFLNEILNDKNN